jgi:CTP synthase (UTP-ammonia lyase)
VDVVWLPTTSLDRDAAARLQDADAIWCAPGGPFLGMEGALGGIRFARERGRPFLGTCAGFQHGVIEFARNVLGASRAHHAEYGAAPDDAPLFVDELLCSLVGQTMTVRVVDTPTRRLYGAERVSERYYCRFGLNEEHTPALERAGLVVAGVDDADGTTRILRLADHPFFYLTLFVPQTSSTPEQPHPIIAGYLAAAFQNATICADSKVAPRWP